jgi:hypothetical protein
MMVMKPTKEWQSLKNLGTERSFSATYLEEVYGNFLWCVDYNELAGE